MEIDISAFHFLRPLWLLLIVPGVAAPWLWLRRHDLKRQLKGFIAPHLVEHLVLRPEAERRLRPVHMLAALLIIGALAAAGPTWQQDTPAFLDNRAPLILAIDLSASMDADDVPPSRIGAARHMLHDLVQRRAGARTALIAYGGSAHLVLPATDDPALLATFIDALSTELLPQPGKDALGVVDLAVSLLKAEHSPGTLVLVTDGADASQFDVLGKRLHGTGLQVLVLAVGSRSAGVIRTADGTPRRGADGSPVQATFDEQALKGLADALDAPLGSLTLDDDDLDWIELHAQRHFQAVSGDGQQVHWKDAGYWLCWPLLLVALLCVRRGWRVNWLGAVAMATLLGGLPSPAHASALLDAFFTADQQGRWAFEHGHYDQAAERFDDPYWKGVSAYQAADYTGAAALLAPLDRAPAYFYRGNSLVRLFKFPEAITAYRQALRIQPDFSEAKVNLALAQALLADYQDQQKQSPPEEKPDKVVEDQTPSAGGKQQEVAKAASDQRWLDNLATSPGQFLKRKFQIQQAARQAPQGPPP
ncbi:VWA domain-containing protein [Pseudomonas sp. BP01]|uniref:vWA domain-containing protein n=1 Tax=Pseudomonas sp. BP01 TaxID=2976152 RepID=UPI001FA9B55D|nr:VWA domain-containing protein [Pseudomonas sp. BP01]